MISGIAFFGLIVVIKETFSLLNSSLSVEQDHDLTVELAPDAFDILLLNIVLIDAVEKSANVGILLRNY